MRCDAHKTTLTQGTVRCSLDQGHAGAHDDGVSVMWGDEGVDAVTVRPPAEREADEAPKRPCNFTREAWEKRPVMAPGEGVRPIPEKEKMKCPTEIRRIDGNSTTDTISPIEKSGSVDPPNTIEHIQNNGKRQPGATTNDTMTKFERSSGSVRGRIGQDEAPVRSVEMSVGGSGITTMRPESDGVVSAMGATLPLGTPESGLKFFGPSCGTSLGAVKYDTGKNRYDLLPPWAEAELVRVFTRGAEKYEPWNWAKGMAWTRIYAAMRRHLYAWLQGEEIDQETGLRHLAQAAWGCMVLLEYQRLGIGTDDRPFKGPLAEKEKRS